MGCNWCCYCLRSESGSTYVGSTVDLDRRLRQHNGEITGGAKATARGYGWQRICYVLGFPDERAALQFEWRWKHITRHKRLSTPTENRLAALVDLVNMEKATAAAERFDSYEGPLQIFIEDNAFKSFFHDKKMNYAVIQD
jgi:predicted GIY-YIG superfamily endonuclease